MVTILYVLPLDLQGLGQFFPHGEVVGYRQNFGDKFKGFKPVLLGDEAVHLFHQDLQDVFIGDGVLTLEADVAGAQFQLRRQLHQFFFVHRHDGR